MPKVNMAVLIFGYCAITFFTGVASMEAGVWLYHKTFPVQVVKCLP